MILKYKKWPITVRERAPMFMACMFALCLILACPLSVEILCFAIMIIGFGAAAMAGSIIEHIAIQANGEKLNKSMTCYYCLQVVLLIVGAILICVPFIYLMLGA